VKKQRHSKRRHNIETETLIMLSLNRRLANWQGRRRVSKTEQCTRRTRLYIGAEVKRRRREDRCAEVATGARARKGNVLLPSGQG